MIQVYKSSPGLLYPRISYRPLHKLFRTLVHMLGQHSLFPYLTNRKRKTDGMIIRQYNPSRSNVFFGSNHLHEPHVCFVRCNHVRKCSEASFVTFTKFSSYSSRNPWCIIYSLIIRPFLELFFQQIYSQNNKSWLSKNAKHMSTGHIHFTIALFVKIR